jgi:hypothetical protein
MVGKPEVGQKRACRKLQQQWDATQDSVGRRCQSVREMVSESDALIWEQSGNIKNSLPILAVLVRSLACLQVLEIPNQGALSPKLPSLTASHNRTSGPK